MTALSLFGASTFVFVAMLLLALFNGNSIAVETRSSGLGGGGGGWRLSSSFSYLLAALLFGGLFASTVWALLRVGEPAGPRPVPAASTPRDTSAKR